MSKTNFVKANTWTGHRAEDPRSVQLRLMTNYCDQRKINTVMWYDMDLDEAKKLRDWLTTRIELTEEGIEKGYI